MSVIAAKIKVAGLKAKDRTKFGRYANARESSELNGWQNRAVSPKNFRRWDSETSR